ncbi:MAG: PrpF domain-containing protein [Candidatus Caldarchaeum sp.]|nr:PrpF domain-containing protein [Candidatus Caldarchaeum sp.]
MRGGTSRGLFLKKHDVENLENLDEVLLTIFGSGSSTQVDGVGGGFTHTSKVMLVGLGGEKDGVVEYTFGQVGVDRRIIDWTGNCGNLTFAVAPFAIDERIVEVDDGLALIQMVNKNTGKRIDSLVPVKNGFTVYEGDLTIDGVPNPGAKVETIWHRPGGAVTGRLLPSGRSLDEFVVNGEVVEVSMVDAANPVVFVRAVDVGMEGLEQPNEVGAQTLNRVEKIRGKAAVAMGLVDKPEEAASKSPHFPFVCVIGSKKSFKTHDGRVVGPEEFDVLIRLFSMQKMHHACAVTAAVCIAVASRVKGSLVAENVDVEGESITIAHPKGLLRLGVKSSGDDVETVSVASTSRRIMAGQVYYP